MKVFSLFNLKMKKGKKSVPLFRPRFTRIHNPNLASQTAKVRNVNINSIETVECAILRDKRKKEIRVSISNLKSISKT